MWTPSASMTWSKSQGLQFSAVVICTIALVSSVWIWEQTSSPYWSPYGRSFCSAQPQGDLEHVPVAVPAALVAPPSPVNVAVASGFSWHFDVWLAVVWTFQRVMMGSGSLQVFAETPFGRGFGPIASELGLYHGDIKKTDELLASMRGQDGDTNKIDLLILGTCIIDLGDWGKELLSIWDARGEDEKFTVVCISHYAGLVQPWEPLLSPWSRRNALRIVTISNHVAKAFRDDVVVFAADPNPVFKSAAFEYVHTDFIVPILNLTLPPHPSSSTKKLSRAVIQGSFQSDRREYPRVFSELIASISGDPQAWGYILPNESEGPAFIDAPESEPFKLHLVGSGSIDIPRELETVVVIHTNLEYLDFYDVMNSMDLCIPAFAVAGEYYSDQASSTVVMCSEVNTPMLVTQRFRDVYKYADDDAILITHPAAMSDIEAIKALRTGNPSDFLERDPTGSGFSLGSHPDVRRGVEKLLEGGWTRADSGFQAWKDKVWKANDAVALRILEGM